MKNFFEHNSVNKIINNDLFVAGAQTFCIGGLFFSAMLRNIPDVMVLLMSLYVVGTFFSFAMSHFAADDEDADWLSIVAPDIMLMMAWSVNELTIVSGSPNMFVLALLSLVSLVYVFNRDRVK